MQKKTKRKLLYRKWCIKGFHRPQVANNGYHKGRERKESGHIHWGNKTKASIGQKVRRAAIFTKSWMMVAIDNKREREGSRHFCWGASKTLTYLGREKGSDYCEQQIQVTTDNRDRKRERMATFDELLSDTLSGLGDERKRVTAVNLVSDKEVHMHRCWCSPRNKRVPRERGTTNAGFRLSPWPHEVHHFSAWGRCKS